MGNGGSSSYYRRKISVNNTDDDCNKIHFITDLQNIQPCITNYNVDDILDVKLDVVERVYVEGNSGICGYITVMSVSQLIKCLKNDKRFIATILDISDSNCKVDITPLQQ